MKSWILRKKDILKDLHAFFEGREKNLDAFENKIFPIKTKAPGFLNFYHFKLKLFIKCFKDYQVKALVQVKVGNNSQNLLNEIRQIVYSFYHNQTKLRKWYTIT